MTDSTANRREEANERKHRRDVLLGSSGHDSHISADDESAATESNEDLAHNYVSDVVAGLAEMDHETDAENLQAQGCESDPFEATRYTDGDGDDDTPETRSDAVDVVDVAGVCDGERVYCLEVCEEIGVPAVEGDEEEGDEQAGADDGAVCEEVEGDEGGGADESFVEGEDYQAHDADNEEGDY